MGKITKHIIFLGLLFFLPVNLAVSAEMDVERWQQVHQRLEFLEQHLGLTPSPKIQNMDRLLQRLEELEKTVFGEIDPMNLSKQTPIGDEPIAPPPQGTESMEWQPWEGDESDALEVQRQQISSNFVSDSLYNLTSPYGLQINGYGIVSFLYDDKRDISTFRANAFELDFTKQIAEWAIFGVDLIFINEGLDPIHPAFRHPAYEGGGSSGAYGSGVGGDDDDDLFIEQLFVRLRAMENLEFTGGKFNVPVGLERRTPDLRYNISPSLLFPLWPRDLTGVMATYKVNDQYSISPYIFNGWDLDENNNNSFIYALYNNYQIHPDLNIAGTVAYGPPFPDNDHDNAFLFDLELRYTGIKDFFAALEYMYVMTETDHIYSYNSMGNVSYQGFLALAHYDFTRLFGLTLQTSLVEDQDGFLFGIDQTRWEFSIIPTLYFTQDLELRLQYQHLESDAYIDFIQRNPKNDRYSKSDDLVILALLWSF